MRFKNPQRPSRDRSARARVLADLFLQIRLNGDLALFQALNRMLLESDAPGAVDRAFIDAHTARLRGVRAHVLRPGLGRRRWRPPG